MKEREARLQRDEDFQPDGPWFSPRLTVIAAPEKAGQAVVARERVAPGELLAVWGGVELTGAELDRLPPDVYAVQVDEDCFLVSLDRVDPGDYVNHSCRPNAGLAGARALVALRAIEPGEEVCFDYAMTESTSGLDFECRCGEPVCRGRVTGDDWRRPDLWRRYGAHFSPYLRARIDRLRRRG